MEQWNSVLWPTAILTPDTPTGQVADVPVVPYSSRLYGFRGDRDRDHSVVLVFVLFGRQISRRHHEGASRRDAASRHGLAPASASVGSYSFDDMSGVFRCGVTDGPRSCIGQPANQRRPTWRSSARANVTRSRTADLDRWRPGPLGRGTVSPSSTGRPSFRLGEGGVENPS